MQSYTEQDLSVKVILLICCEKLEKKEKRLN